MAARRVLLLSVDGRAESRTMGPSGLFCDICDLMGGVTHKEHIRREAQISTV